MKKLLFILAIFCAACSAQKQTETSKILVLKDSAELKQNYIQLQSESRFKSKIDGKIYKITVKN